MPDKSLDDAIMSKLEILDRSVAQDESEENEEIEGVESLVDQYRIDQLRERRNHELVMALEKATMAFTNSLEKTINTINEKIVEPVEEVEPVEQVDDQLVVEEQPDDDSEYTFTTDITEHNINEEWDNVVLQLELLVGIVIVPLLGKFLGRRFAHKIWSFIGNWYYS